MTRTTNARLAGFTFLFYIATGVTSIVLSGQAIGAGGPAAKLANIARHATTMRVDVLLTLLQFACAFVLAVTLYALTRDQDRDLAVLALCCRAGEGVIAAISPIRTLGLLSVATASQTAAGPDAAAAMALGALLLKIGDWSGLIAATCFAAGSTIFSWLFLRARSIPVWLAWLGVCASILILLILPAQLAGFVNGPVTDFMWLPILVFELVLAFWLLIKGVAPIQSLADQARA